MEVRCTYCGTVLKRAPWQVKPRKFGCFCSGKCYGRWQSINRRGARHPSFEKGKIDAVIVKALYSQGVFQRDIAKKFGVCQSAISKICRRYGLKNKRLNVANLESSDTLWYIVGVVFGDGTLDASQYGIKLAVSNEKFANSFNEALRKIGLRTCSFSQIQGPYKTLMYVVEANSKNLFEWLKSLKIAVSEIIVPTEFIPSFLRGMYESEGTLTKGNQVLFTNTNGDLILLSRKLIETMGFSTSVSRREQRGFGTKPVYILYVLGGTERRKEFLRLVNPCIKRWLIEEK